MKIAANISLALLALMIIKCGEDAFESKSYPYLISLDPKVSVKGVTLKAEVLDKGTVGVKSYGFIFSNSETLDLAYAIRLKGPFKKGEYSFTLQSSLQDGITYYVRPFAETNSYVVYGDLVSFQAKGSLTPNISSFTPTEGGIGTQVVITGENFGYIPLLTSVKFGNTSAIVDSITNDKLYTRVPSITAPQLAKITVTTGGASAISANDFDLWFPWKRLADFPGTYLSSLASFVAQGKIYVLGGLTLNPRATINEFWQYDPATNMWTSLAPFPGNARYQAIAFTCNDKGYFGLGKNDAGYFKDFWEYDPSTGMWKQLKDYPGKTSSNQLSFAASNKGYVGLGYTFPGEVYTKEMWEYDPVANDWARAADFSGNGRNPGLALSAGSTGFMGMGSTVNSFKDIYEYNPTGNAWTFVTNYPGNGYNDMASFYMNNKIYVGLGSSGSKSHTDFREFDPTTMMWKSMQVCPTKISPYMSLTIGNKGYVGLGWYNQVLADDEMYGVYLWEFDPGKN